jgi:hypothetical protein
MSGDEMEVAMAAAGRAFQIASDAVEMAERCSEELGRVLDVFAGWRDAAMLFYASHNNWGYDCFCERCMPVRVLLDRQATSSMVE